MAKNNEHIITVKEGKKTRKFLLTDEEYEEFCWRYEENELISKKEQAAFEARLAAGNIKIVETPMPNITVM